MDKPVSIIIDELNNNFLEVLNTSGVHISIVEIVLKNLYEDVHKIAVNTAVQEKSQYEKALIEKTEQAEPEKMEG